MANLMGNLNSWKSSRLSLSLSLSFFVVNDVQHMMFQLKNWGTICAPGTKKLRAMTIATCIKSPRNDGRPHDDAKIIEHLAPGAMIL